MARKIKDTDYLTVSAEIRAMENMLLRREKLAQAAAAPSVEEALKLVQESGYPALHSAEAEAIDGEILAQRQSLEGQLHLPDERIVEIFRYPHDYHNLKTLLKARFAGVDGSHILVPLGRMDPLQMRQAVEEGAWERLPGRLGEAGAAAKELLDTTRDGQLMDIFLDRACYEEKLAAAQQSGSTFLVGFVRRSIDSANLRALVRTLRMKKPVEFLRQVLISGGTVGEEEILSVSANGGSGLLELYDSTAFAAAAEQADLTGNAPLTDFERLCDDAVTAYLDRAERIPFGEEVVIAYFAAKETEFTNLRIALLGRSMGLPADVITKRLRA